MKHTLLQIRIFLLAAILHPALASAEGMAEYAAAARDDMSLNLLKTIVGSVTGVFDGGGNSPLGAMFMVLNVAIAAVAVIFAAYGTIAAIVDAAQRGELMGGSKYNKLWMPVKMGTGLGGLLPALGGWNAAQVAMLWAAIWGIGIGNKVWQAGSSTMLSWVSSPIVAQRGVDPSSATITSLLESQTCYLSHNAHAETSGSAQLNGIMQANPRPTPGGYEIVYGGAPGSAYSSGACGGIRFERSAAGDEPGILETGNLGAWFAPSGYFRPFSADDIFAAHRAAMDQMAAAVEPLAQRVLDEGVAPTPQELAQVKQRYRETVAAALAAAVQNGNSGFQSYMEGAGRSWLTAGIIFMKIAGVNKQIQDAADLQPTSISPRQLDQADPTLAQGISDGLAAVRRALDEVGEIDFSPSAIFARLFSDEMSSPIASAVMDFLTGGNQDLLSATMAFGRRITGLAVSGWIGAAAALGIIEKASDATLALSMPQSIAMSASMMLLVAFVPLIGVGLLYGFYLPMLPFIIWMGALMSWLITVVEGLIAAPLWALAHLHAEGEGMGRETSHGYLFLLHLLFRPALMIFGLVLGWLCLQTFGGILKYGLSIVYGAGGPGTTGLAGIFGFFAMLAVFGVIAMMLVNRAFALIHLLPDTVFRWIGAHIQSSGGREGETTQAAIVAAGAFTGKEGHSAGARKIKQIEENLIRNNGPSISADPTREK